MNLGSPIVCQTPAGGTWMLSQQLVKLLTSLGVYGTSGTASSSPDDVTPSLLA